jgi:hypothetical protein
VFDPAGTAYFASLAKPPEGGGGIYVHRSTDAGASWGLPVLAVADTRDVAADVCTSSDKEWLSVDPHTSEVYLAYTSLTFRCSSPPDPVGIGDFARISDTGIYLTASEDGGQTWRPPQRLWTGYALGAIPKVGPDGTLHVAFWASVPSSDAFCPSLPGTLLVHSGGKRFAAIVVMSSSDNGETWRYHQEGTCPLDLAEQVKPGRFVGGNILPTLATDATTGFTYVAWPTFDVARNRFKIELSSSADGGRSWSTAREVPTDPADARMPAVSADAGVVRLVYVRSTGEGTGDTLVIESSDGGSTWSSPFRLSTVSAQLANHPEVGDYIGVDVADGHVVTIWTDARNSSPTEIWARGGSAR